MRLPTLVSFILVYHLFTIISFANSAKILVIHSVASYSHRVAIWPLAEALSSKGHELTYLSPYHPKQPNPNITELVTKNHVAFNEQYLEKEFDINLRVENKMTLIKDHAFEFGYGGCEAILSSPELHDWLKANKKIDLVIADNCFAECGVALAHKLSAKSIIFSTVATLPFEYDMLGYVPESAYIPELDLNSPTVPMGFFARVSNTLMSLRWSVIYAMYSWRVDHLLRTELKVPKMPYIGDLMSKVNLVFYTGDVMSDYPRSLPPNFVNVAGIHCKESSGALPEEIEKFLQANETALSPSDGFVYISLGSLAVSSSLPDHIKQVFFETIKSFPKLKFLWKWNGEFPKDIPENLYLGKWFPQIDLLGHPKIRAFVTQNGRPSTLEALYNGVPLISFPILGDQDFNSNRLAETGSTIRLEIGKVTREEFKEAVRKSVYDPSVKTRMTKVQKIFRDRPMSPLDTAVWWTEYVLRSEDTMHLRPAGVEQNWFVRRQIDVWAFLSISMFTCIVGSLYFILKFSQKIFMSNEKVKTT